MDLFHQAFEYAKETVPLPPPPEKDSISKEPEASLEKIVENIPKDEKREFRRIVIPQKPLPETLPPIDTGSVSMRQIQEVMRDATKIKDTIPLPPPEPYRRIEIASVKYIEDVPEYEEKLKKYEFAHKYYSLGKIGNERLYNSYGTEDMAESVAKRLNELYGKDSFFVSTKTLDGHSRIRPLHESVYKVYLAPKPLLSDYEDILDKKTMKPLPSQSQERKVA